MDRQQCETILDAGYVAYEELKINDQNDASSEVLEPLYEFVGCLESGMDLRTFYEEEYDPSVYQYAAFRAAAAKAEELEPTPEH